MLILSRKEGEAVVIPKFLIRVTVTRIEGNRVKLGFEGPVGAAIVREEILTDAIDLPAEDRAVSPSSSRRIESGR